MLVSLREKTDKSLIWCLMMLKKKTTKVIHDFCFVLSLAEIY